MQKGRITMQSCADWYWAYAVKVLRSIMCVSHALCCNGECFDYCLSLVEWRCGSVIVTNAHWASIPRARRTRNIFSWWMNVRGPYMAEPATRGWNLSECTWPYNRAWLSHSGIVAQSTMHCIVCRHCAKTELDWLIAVAKNITNKQKTHNRHTFSQLVPRICCLFVLSVGKKNSTIVYIVTGSWKLDDSLEKTVLPLFRWIRDLIYLWHTHTHKTVNQTCQPMLKHNFCFISKP